MWQDTRCLGSHEEKETVDAWRVVTSRLYVQIDKKTVSLLSKSLLPLSNLTGLWLPCPDDLVWVEQAERVERLLELFVVVSLRSSRRSNRYWEYAKGKTKTGKLHDAARVFTVPGTRHGGGETADGC